MYRFVFAFVQIAVYLTLTEGYKVCGGADSVDETLNDKLISAINGQPYSQAIISLQLANNSATNSYVSWLKGEVAAYDNKTNIGRLARDQMAARSLCQNTSDFSGVNLNENLVESFNRQFDNREDNLLWTPRDGLYSTSLAMQAICISKLPLKNNLLDFVLQMQHLNGSFGPPMHGIDVASQMTLALSCLDELMEEVNPLKQRVRQAIQRARSYLHSRGVTRQSHFYFGNKYSTPHALLALMVSHPGGPIANGTCRLAARSIFQPTTAKESVAWNSNLLQALNGKSVLSLRGDLTCQPNGDESEILVKPQLEFNPTCQPVSLYDSLLAFFRIDIHVKLSVLSSTLWSGLGTNSTFTMTDVIKDTTLLNIMKQAQCENKLSFKVKYTSWGPSLVSVNGRAASQSNREFWALINVSDGKLLPLGVGKYLPSHNAHIGFKLMKY